ncbi:MAG TPA: hypothetical protein VE178_04420, partial [Silvibacterium sp.]|nr:hypothetical protein [Silvibacterium sp.]
MFSFARITRLWLAAAPVKASDELAPLGLDRRLASRKSPHIRAKKTSDMNLSKQRNKHIQRVLIEAAKLAPRECHELAVIRARELERG